MDVKRCITVEEYSLTVKLSIRTVILDSFLHLRIRTYLGFSSIRTQLNRQLEEDLNGYNINPNR